MVLAGDAVEPLDRHPLYQEATPLDQVEKLLGQVALQLFAYQNLVYLLTGFDGLDNGPNAKYHFILFHCSVRYGSTIRGRCRGPQP